MPNSNKAIKYPHTFMSDGTYDGAWAHMYCAHCGVTWTKGYEKCPIEECPAFKMFYIIPKVEEAASAYQEALSAKI